MKRQLTFILGPTCSGKSRAAFKLALRTGGEIVSCDSMQIYRDMDIITQAPSDEDMDRVPHHLVKVIPPEEEYNAARYAADAAEAIEGITARGMYPIITGGTGLYFSALVDGISPLPAKDEGLRERLRKTAGTKGREYLYRRLRGIDPAAADRIHPNDLRRIIRAIEVYELTGETMDRKKTACGGISEKYDIRVFAPDVPRSELYERINARVEEMFKRGLVDEVRALLKRNLSITARNALGIKEVACYLSGNMTLEQAKEELKKNTRRYAKRQFTWFKADKRIIWARDPEDIRVTLSGGPVGGS